MVPEQIAIFDEPRDQWRSFTVMPARPYKVRCGNGLHQMDSNTLKCACGKVELASRPRAERA